MSREQIAFEEQGYLIVGCEPPQMPIGYVFKRHRTFANDPQSKTREMQILVVGYATYEEFAAQARRFELQMEGRHTEAEMRAFHDGHFFYKVVAE